MFLDAIFIYFFKKTGNTHREDGGLCITISSEEGEDADHYRSRAQLQRIWGNLRLFFKPQPLEAIRQYFGSKIAMYYLWLNVCSGSGSGRCDLSLHIHAHVSRLILTTSLNN